jgi:hypothetical protein
MVDENGKHSLLKLTYMLVLNVIGLLLSLVFILLKICAIM